MKSILHLKEKDYQSYFELINEWKVSKFSNEVFRNFINDLNENHQLFGLFENDELNATASVLFEKKCFGVVQW